MLRLRSRSVFLLLAAFAIAFVASSAWAQSLPRVTISVDSSGESTRVVIGHDRKITRAVIAGDGSVEILYAEPVELAQPSGTVEDGILAGWSLSGERRLLLYAGAGFQSYESFELSNPDRLILDLKGNRQAGAADPFRPAAPDRSGQTVIVIDPGHGGSEKGAVGPTGLAEKEVTLDLAKRLRDVLEREPGVTVVLTRSDDRLVELDERTAIANHNQADLFVSLHLNAAPRRSAKGTETYYLSMEATDDEARTSAALENRSPGGASEDEDPALELILWDLAQNSHLGQSSQLAESVQDHLNRLTGTRNRGVKQAPFRVLMGATMPAILVEVGFISNPDEEARFRTVAYREKVVEAVAGAVNEFRANLDHMVGQSYKGGGESGSASGSDTFGNR